MKISVLINCYNYGRFVGEAIASVRCQTHAPDELLVVDDGSTDDSEDQINQALQGYSRGQLISRQNGGQLAAFNTGFLESSGDILFFLDADDCYEPLHIEKVLGVFQQNKDVGFVFTVHRRTDDPNCIVNYKRGSGDLGPSAILVWLTGSYIGSVTSSIAMRRSVAGRFMPLPVHLEKDWVTRADDCLILASSLTGTRKFFLPEPTFRYRMHESNAFAKRHQSRFDRYAHSLRVCRFMQTIRSQFNYDWRSSKLLYQEFRSIHTPGWKCFRDYLKAARFLKVSVSERMVLRCKLPKQFLGARQNRPLPTASEATIDPNP